MMLPAIWQLIEVLREAHRAPLAQWRSFANSVDALPKVPISEAGIPAHFIADAARRVLTQLPHIHPSSEAATRMSLLSLSDFLNQEANANGCPFPRPFYAKD